MCGRTGIHMNRDIYRISISNQFQQPNNAANPSNATIQNPTASTASNFASTNHPNTDHDNHTTQDLQNLNIVETSNNARQELSPNAEPQIEWEDEELFKPGYNITPTSHLPILYDSKCKLKLASMFWGLYPISKQKEEASSFSNLLINAKLETLKQRPTFAKLLKQSQRGVLFVDGFFEWKKSGSQKKPFFITNSNRNEQEIENAEKTSGTVNMIESCLCFACLFDKPDGHPEKAFTILTMSSKGTKLEPIHER